jgi:hypothetical protein
MSSPSAVRKIDAMIDRDCTNAAWTATLKQRAIEEAAAGYEISVEEYMRSMDLFPTAEFAERPPLADPIEADHLFAFATANARARARENSDPMARVRELNQAAFARSIKL